MMVDIWTNKLSLDNRVIDTEHRNILNLINVIDDLIDQGDVAEMIDAFRHLVNSLCVYFQTEEHIANVIGVDFSKHKVAHQELLNELLQMRDRLEENSSQLADKETRNLALNWVKNFTRHIQKEGKQMKRVLGSQYYDYQPE